MTTKRKIEVFSAGCTVCEDVIEMIKRAACPSCEVTLHDMNDINVAKRARDLGVRSVPAVAIDGRLAPCCTGAGVDEPALRAAGLGQSLADSPRQRTAAPRRGAASTGFFGPNA
jgi:hypothetical protein